MQSTQNNVLSTGDIVELAVAVVVSSSIFIAAIVRHRIHKKTKQHASWISGGDEGKDKAEPAAGEGELENTQQSQYLEMPVAAPKELSAKEARRPELPDQPPFLVSELPESTTELEDASIVHGHSVTKQSYRRSW